MRILVSNHCFPISTRETVSGRITVLNLTIALWGIIKLGHKFCKTFLLLQFLST